MKILPLFVGGLLAGSLVAIQNVLMAGMGRKVGSLGSIFIMSIVTLIVIAIPMIVIPGAAALRSAPGPAEWYWYAAGVMGVVILAASILLVQRIGASSTLTALVVGQLVTALVLDHFGWMGIPRSEISLVKVAGLVLLVTGAYFIVKN